MLSLWIAVGVLAGVFLIVLGYGVLVRHLGAPVPFVVARRRFTGRHAPLPGWGAWADVLWAVAVVAAALAVAAALS